MTRSSQALLGTQLKSRKRFMSFVVLAPAGLLRGSCGIARTGAFIQAKSHVFDQKFCAGTNFVLENGHMTTGLKPGLPKAFVGRSERIRTSGPCLPKTVLYQAELHSDRKGRGYTPLCGAGQVNARRE